MRDAGSSGRIFPGLGLIVVGGLGALVFAWGAVSLGPDLFDSLMGGARCTHGPSQPIEIQSARESLESVGYSVKDPNRARLCGHTAIQAQLQGTRSGGIHLDCLVSSRPHGYEHVTTLPDTAGGAINVVAENVQCFVYAPLALQDDERTRISRALQRMLE
jgi:hypothetical protein